MNNKILTHMLCLFASFFVFIWCLYLLDFNAEVIFALMAALLTFSLCNYLTANDEKPLMITSFRLFGSKHIPEIFFVFSYALSLTLVFLVPSITQPYYIEWLKIPFLNWLRLFASILLSTFFPGYVLLYFIKRKSNFNKLEIVIFSFFLSLFLTSLYFFICISLNIINQFDEQVVLLPHLLLLPIFTINLSRKIYVCRNRDVYVNKLQVSIYKLIAIVSLLSIIVIGSYTITLGNPYQAGDQWEWIGRSLQFQKGSFPVINDRVIPFYPYWFDLFLSSFFTISGFPILNAYGSLSFLTVLPTITLYLLLGQLFKQKKAPLVGTVLSTFLGFGWMYFIYQKLILNPNNLVDVFEIIRLTGNKTYDTWNGILFLPIEGIRPLFLFGFPILFTLVYLLVRGQKKGVFNWSDSFLFTILIAVGFLGHVVEVLFFIAIYLLSVLFGHKYHCQFKRINFSIILGLLIVAVIDFFAPGKYYTVLKSAEGLVRSPYFFIPIFSVLCMSLFQFMQQKKFMPHLKMFKLGHKGLNILSKILVGLGSHILILSIITWLWILDSLPSLGAIIPWYMYWMRFGVVGILGFIGFICLIHKKREEPQLLSIFFIIALTYFILLLLGRLPFFIHFDEGRLMSLLSIALILPGAYLIVHYTSKLNLSSFKHKSIFVILLTLIIVGGLSSTLLKFQFFSLIETRYGEESEVPYAYLSKEEMAALNYIQTNLLPNASVASSSAISRSKLEGLGGMSMMQARSSLGWGGDNENTWNFLFSSDSPEAVTYLLNSLNVDYIYLTQRDLTEFDKKVEHCYMATHLLKYLPIAFNNSEVTIYEIPSMSTASFYSNLSLVLQEQTQLFDVIAQEQIDYNKGSHLISSATILAQRFKPITTQISKVGILVERKGLPDAGVTIEIREDENGTPDSAFLAKSYIQVESINPNLNEVVMDLACSNLDPSKFYHFLIYSNASNLETENIFYRIYLKTEDVTPTGYFLYWGQGFSEWDIHYDKDLYFRIWSPIQEKIPFLDLPDVVDRLYFFPIQMISLSRYNYTVFLGADNNIFDSSTIILNHDPPIGTDLDEYLRWIKEGGRLIVLNSLEPGAFSDFLDIQIGDVIKTNGIENTNSSITIPKISVPHFSAGSKDIASIGNYTHNANPVSSFAFQKNIEKGELLYVEVFPYFSSLLNGSDSLRRSLFAKFDVLLGILNLSSEYTLQNSSVSINYPYVLASGRTTFENNVEIMSNSLILYQLRHLVLNSLDLSASNYSEKTDMGSDEAYNNFQIVDLKIHGPSLSFLNSLQVTFDSFENSLIHGAYIPLQLESDFTWTLYLQDQTRLTLSLINESGTDFEIETRGGRVVMSFTPIMPIHVYFKNPMISIQGDVIFSKANIYALPYHPLTSGDYVEIYGNTSFKIDCSDTSQIFISDFDSDGKINVVSTSSAIDIKIPWKEVLSSPIHLFFLVSITFWLGWNVRGSIPKREKGRKDPT